MGCWACLLLLHTRSRLLLLLHLHLQLTDCLHQLLLLVQSLLQNPEQLRRFHGFMTLSEQ